MTTDAGSTTVRVEVVYALPDRYLAVRLDLPGGSTVSQALAAAALDGREPEIEIDPARLAIFSRPVLLTTILRDGDRLELLRPLIADPKQSRRVRARESLPKKR